MKSKTQDSTISGLRRWLNVSRVLAQELNGLSRNHDAKHYGIKVCTGQTTWIDVWKNTKLRENLPKQFFTDALSPRNIDIDTKRSPDSVWVMVPRHRLREATELLLAAATARLRKFMNDYNQRHILITRVVLNHNYLFGTNELATSHFLPPTARELELISQGDL